MLEHLDRHHPIEGTLRFERIDIRCEYVHIAQTATPGGVLNVEPLASRIGHGHHLGMGTHLGDPQRPAPPATAKIQDTHAVAHPGAQRRQAQHRLFRLRERRHTVRPAAAAVFEPRTEHAVEEGGRYLVVLAVSDIRYKRDWPRPHGVNMPRRGALQIPITRGLLLSESLP